MSGQYDHLVKLMLLGHVHAKSSIHQCLGGDLGRLPTLGIDVKYRTMELDGQVVRLHIGDSAGQERFRTITPSHYRGVHAVIVVYDVADMKSFTDAKNWLIRCTQEPNIEAVLIGNECDPTAEPSTSRLEAEELAETLGIKFFEFPANHDIETLETVFAYVVRKRISSLGEVTPTNSTSS